MPTRIDTLGGAVHLAARGYAACATRADGSIRCAGMNDAAMLGDGTTTPSLDVTPALPCP